mmetsp:Transcript_77298/g.196346  ORF Transcript_77298/g.196346 Transcript_77298/m.196346 type:complete len:271 (-) Transcript_77298:2-814(-)
MYMKPRSVRRPCAALNCSMPTCSTCFILNPQKDFQEFRVPSSKMLRSFFVSRSECQSTAATLACFTVLTVWFSVNGLLTSCMYWCFRTRNSQIASPTKAKMGLPSMTMVFPMRSLRWSGGHIVQSSDGVATASAALASEASAWPCPPCRTVAPIASTMALRACLLRADNGLRRLEAARETAAAAAAAAAAARAERRPSGARAPAATLPQRSCAAGAEAAAATLPPCCSKVTAGSAGSDADGDNLNIAAPPGGPTRAGARGHALTQPSPST